jgi:hypothetical protein
MRSHYYARHHHNALGTSILKLRRTERDSLEQTPAHTGAATNNPARQRSHTPRSRCAGRFFGVRVDVIGVVTVEPKLRHGGRNGRQSGSRLKVTSLSQRCRASAGRHEQPGQTENPKCEPI